jgi:signal transduction histidine kinase
MRARSIRFAVAGLAALLVTVCQAAMIAYVSGLAYETTLRYQTDNMKVMAQTIETGMSNMMQQGIDSATFLAASPEIVRFVQAGNNQMQAQELLERYEGSIPDVDSLFIYDLNGMSTLNISQGGFGDNQDLDLRDRTYVRATRGGRAAWHPIPIVSRLTRHIIVVVAAPVVDQDNAVIGGVGVALNFENAIRQYFSSVKIGRSGYPYMLSSDGTVIAHPDSETMFLNVSDEDFIKRTLSAPEGVTEYQWRGRDKVQTWRRMPLTGWTVVASTYKDELIEPALEQRKSILAIGAASLLVLIAGIVWFMEFLAIRPLRALETYSRAVTGGDTSASLRGRFRFEFKTLAENMRAMVGSLQDLAHEAQDANMAKSRFLANMSHEIRTPMNAVIGTADLLAFTELTAKQRDYLGILTTSAKSLLMLINDILDFSKIEAGRLDLDLAPFDLEDVVAQVADIHVGEAAKRHIEFTAEIAPDVPSRVVWDSLRVKQVLSNLTSNALKFTESGTVSILLSVVARHGDKVELLFGVKDTGIGISMKTRDKLFQPFTQADAATTRKFGGTGLGLAICKSLVEMMGGRIWVESEPGRGSLFQFTGVFLVDKQPEDLSAGLPENLVGLRALVVDDNADSRRNVGELLARLGLRACGVEDAMRPRCSCARPARTKIRLRFFWPIGSSRA